MAMGILPADTSVTNPHPRAKNHIRARYPPRVASLRPCPLAAGMPCPRICLCTRQATTPTGGWLLGRRIGGRGQGGGDGHGAAAGVDLGDADGGRAVERRSRGPRRREGAVAGGGATPGGPRRRESGGRRPEEEGGADRWLRGAGGGNGAGGAGRWAGWGRRLALGSGEGTRETLESLVEMIYIQGYYCVRGHMSAGLRVFGFGY